MEILGCEIRDIRATVRYLHRLDPDYDVRVLDPHGPVLSELVQDGLGHLLGRPVGLRPHLHIPYNPDLFAELNVERFELSKTGKILFNHPDGTHNDRFWALTLTVYAPKIEPSKSLLHNLLSFMLKKGFN